MNTVVKLNQVSPIEAINSAVVSLEEYFEGTGDVNPSLKMSLKTVQSFARGDGLFTDTEALAHKSNAMRLAERERRFCIQAINNNLPNYHDCDIDCLQDVIDGLNAVEI